MDRSWDSIIIVLVTIVLCILYVGTINQNDLDDCQSRGIDVATCYNAIEP